MRWQSGDGVDGADGANVADGADGVDGVDGDSSVMNNVETAMAANGDWGDLARRSQLGAGQRLPWGTFSLGLTHGKRLFGKFWNPS